MNPFARRYSRLGGFRLGLAAAIVAAALAPPAHSATVVVTWTNPTTNTDDSQIPAAGEGSLSAARVQYGTCSAPGVFGTAVGDVPRARGSGAMPTSATLNLPVGQSCVRVFVTNTYSVESDASNVAVRTIDPPKPKPPVLATVAPQVFDVRPNERTFGFDRGRLVGTVKLGAACDEDRTTGDDFYALERPSRVNLTRAPRSTALVARCGESAAPVGDATRSAADFHLDDGGRMPVGSGLLTAAL